MNTLCVLVMIKEVLNKNTIDLIEQKFGDHNELLKTHRLTLRRTMSR
jgi:hypothetical protein